MILCESSAVRYGHFLRCLPCKIRKDTFEMLAYSVFIIIFFFFFFHGSGRLTSSGNDALPSFPRASTISSSSRFVVEGVFRESGIVHSFKMVDPVLFAFGSHVLYSRDLQVFCHLIRRYPRLCVFAYEYCIFLGSVTNPTAKPPLL